MGYMGGCYTRRRYTYVPCYAEQLLRSLLTRRTMSAEADSRCRVLTISPPPPPPQRVRGSQHTVPEARVPHRGGPGGQVLGQQGEKGTLAGVRHNTEITGPSCGRRKRRAVPPTPAT